MTRQHLYQVEPDHYVQSAEVYDILSALHWHNRRNSVRALLQSVPVADGAVLDIGAGTGGGVRVIADALPAARIVAIEPSASMRVGLMTRILMDDQLRRQVTVNASSIQDAELPQDFSAALVCGCIGYLEREERLAMWRNLRNHIHPQGFVLADVMQLDRARPIPPMKAASTSVGDHQYDVWVSGTPGIGDLMQWDMRCDIIKNAATIRSFNVVRQWHTFGIGQLVEEAATAGFRSELLQDSPVPAAVLRPSPHRS